jgi:hypothetical protein
MNNPQKILETLDSYLEKETRMVLFGRASLALGYGDQGSRFGRTQDVDAILPEIEMARIELDSQFWKAIDLTNKKLQPLGLYISHLFTDRQVVLTSGWLEKIVPLSSIGYRCLRLYRPSSVDLILTKMMRNDKEDIEDIRFIIGHDKIEMAQLDIAFAEAKRTEVAEIQDIFLKMQPTVRAISTELSRGRRGESRIVPGTPSLDPDWWSKLTDQPKGDPEKGTGT